MNNIRLMSIQHGDYAEALRIIGRGDLEPYFGMSYSLKILSDFFGSNPYLVVSLNAPASREQLGQGTLVGLPRPCLPRLIPGRFSELIWSRRILAEMKCFQPTHVLVRTGGPRAVAILKYCIQNKLNTAVIFANYFNKTNDKYSSNVIRKLVPLLNHPCVTVIGNHKQPATDSMIECGVDPSKVAAWDWPSALHPIDFTEKKLQEDGDFVVLYVGTISTLKGVGDLVEAVRLLLSENVPVRLIAVGDGPDIEKLQFHSSTFAEGSVNFLGRIPNSEAFQLMLKASVVCVPSHHAFTEGMPLTLTEALASRTPTIISDHPVFQRAFLDGEGVRVVPEKNPKALAAVLRELLSNPVEYTRLSRGTLDAFERVECKTFFGDLINRWRTTFNAH